MSKHAFLIIAHNEFDILEKTIRLLDDKDNDIYLHIDKKLNLILIILKVFQEKVIFRKGANWVSITDDFLKYVLSKEKWVLKVFRYSFCADELFIQTILYNSDFYKNICSLKNDDYLSLKRYIDWKRGAPYTFKLRDYDDIVNSKCFFARKFSTKVDDKIVQKIYEKGMSERGES